MRLFFIVIICFFSMRVVGASLTVSPDGGGYYVVTGIDVGGIRPTYYQDGTWCNGGYLDSGLTITGGYFPYTCSKYSNQCSIPYAQASNNDPSALIATLIGTRIPEGVIKTATGWSMFSYTGLWCSPHPSLAEVPAAWYWTNTTINVGPPPPPSCSVSDTSIVMSGRLGDTIRGSNTIEVSCDKPADVGLVIAQNGKLDLRDGGLINLAFRESGATSIHVSGLTARLTIDGVLTQSPTGPGNYTGSTVVQVQYQ